MNLRGQVQDHEIIAGEPDVGVPRVGSNFSGQWWLRSQSGILA